MENNYTFHCPVKGEGANVKHCQKVHSNNMQGYPEKTEDKICALAHICYMCPFRCAVRVGGPWSHPDKFPKSEKPQETPVKLPTELVKYALTHTTPKDTDYRRVGMWGDDVGIHSELFNGLQMSALDKHLPSSVPRQSSKPKQKAKPKTVSAALEEGFNKNELADAVTDAIKKEQKNSAHNIEGTSKQSAVKKPVKRAEKPAQSVPAPSSKPMTLAERAKMMKANKS